MNTLWRTFHPLHRSLNRSVGCCSCNFSSDNIPIEIPKRIPRGPTDILRAISNTIGRDPTAAHYKYHDDPYLIPYSNLSKRSYGMSQEAGRKAAQWVREQHSELFQHKVADPMIEAYVPKPIYTEETNVNENILRNVIMNRLVNDAFTVYDLLTKKNIDISLETKQSLFELACFYNSQEPLHDDWIEERWFRQGNFRREKIRNTWKSNIITDSLFKELTQNEKYKPAAYCAMITGMINYGQLDQGWKLYEEAKTNGIQLNVHAYNALISKCPALREGHNLVLDVLESFVREMNDAGVKPNIITLNSILETLSHISSNQNAKQLALKAVSEFKQLGIMPSLATFYWLLNIYFNDDRALSGIMLDILTRTKGQIFSIKDPKDTMFFVRAMEIISVRLNNKSLAYQLDDLLHTGDNYNLMGYFYNESVYYRHFLTVLFNSEPFEVFMETYNNLVPNIYIPEPTIMNNILSQLELQSAWNYLPKLWSDIVMFELADRSQILEHILNITRSCPQSDLNQSTALIAWGVWEKVESDRRRENKTEWTGPMLGNVLFNLLKADDLIKAHLVLDKLERLQGSIIGEPRIEELQLYVQLCIDNKNADAAIRCIRYCSAMGFIEAESLAAKLNSSLDITNQQLQRLTDIVGNDCLNKN